MYRREFTLTRQLQDWHDVTHLNTDILRYLIGYVFNLARMTIFPQKTG